MEINPTSSLDQTLEDLSEILHEDAFFKGLGDLIFSQMETDRLLIYKVLKDSSLRPVVKCGKNAKENLKKPNDSLDYVLKNQRPYLNNAFEDDFPFQGDKDQLSAELCFPILYKEILLGIISLQAFSRSSLSYSSEDVDFLREIVSRLNGPCEKMKKSLEKNTLKRKKENKSNEIFMNFQKEEIVGKNMKDLMAFADKMGSLDIPLLIEGERGTGKEMIARRIHFKSNRKNFPFIVVDASSLYHPSVKDELFGDPLRPGLLETAHKGTLVLKNIFQMPVSVQERLALYLKGMNQEDSRSFDVRIIGISQENSEEMTKKGLLCLLDTVTVKVPPLCKRKEDISSLANYFLKRIFPEKSLSTDALQILEKYSWPGNVGELEMIIMEASMTTDKILKKEHFIGNTIENKKTKKIPKKKFIEKTLKEIEEKHVMRTLEHF